eukprot:1825464-Rhodomonas_salina.1
MHVLGAYAGRDHGSKNSLSEPKRGVANSMYISQCGVDPAIQIQQAPIPRNLSNVLFDMANAAGLGGGSILSMMMVLYLELGLAA